MQKSETALGRRRGHYFPTDRHAKRHKQPWPATAPPLRTECNAHPRLAGYGLKSNPDTSYPLRIDLFELNRENCAG